MNRHHTQSSAYAWLIILLCSSLLFYKYVLSVSPSIITNELMSAFHMSGVRLGNLAASFFYTFLIVQLFVGVLLDKFGARWLAGFSVAISAAGALLFADAQTILQAEWARAMMGFGAAFATVTYLKMAAVWFKPNQTAFVGGLLATAVMLGAVFGEAPLAMLVDSLGWRAALAMCGIFGVIIAVVFVIFVRDQPAELSHEMALSTDKFCLADLKAVLSNPQNWLLTFYSGLAFSPLAVFGGLWGNPFLKITYHLTRVEAASLVSIMFVGLGLGSPLFGFLSDRFNQRRLMMFFGTSLALLTLVAIIYLPLTTFWVLALLLFLFGFGTGAFMLCFALGRQHNKLAVTATVIALINTGDGILGSLSEPLIGKILDLNWDNQIVDGARIFSVNDYHLAFLPLILYLLLAIILIIFIQEKDS